MDKADFQIIRRFLENELMNYKRMQGIVKGVDIEGIGVQAQVLSGMPHTITNKFSSVVEVQAFNRNELKELKKDINRIKNCLSILKQDILLFSVTELIINGHSLPVTIKKYKQITGDYYSEGYFKYNKNKALQIMTKHLIDIKFRVRPS
jgi:hypothetical protein